MGRHGRGYLAPTTECVSLLGRLLCGGDNVAISNGRSLINLAVNNVCKSVAVDTECTFDCYIMGRHGGRYLAPTTECVSLLGRFLCGGDNVAISNGRGLINLAVNNICKSVAVYNKCCRAFYIFDYNVTTIINSCTYVF